MTKLKHFVAEQRSGSDKRHDRPPGGWVLRLACRPRTAPPLNGTLGRKQVVGHRAGRSRCITLRQPVFSPSYPLPPCGLDGLRPRHATRSIIPTWRTEPARLSAAKQLGARRRGVRQPRSGSVLGVAQSGCAGGRGRRRHGSRRTAERVRPVEYGEHDGQTLTGYLARSESGGVPGVILIQEWWGLNAHIEDVADRLAAEGFVVLAPDLSHGTVVSEPDEAHKLVMELDREATVDEINLATAYLLGQDDVSSQSVGVMGFCMGGGLSLAGGASGNDALGAVIAFYGAPLGEDDAAQVSAPVLGRYGSEDGGIPIDDVRAMESALEAAGVENDIPPHHITPSATPTARTVRSPL